MVALQRLTLHLLIACDDVFIDPLDLIEQLASDMSQLHSFNFNARAENQIAQPSRCSFRQEAAQHEKRKRYGQVWNSVVSNDSSTFHHAFTLPFQFTQLQFIGREFPETRFQYVAQLWVSDVEFDHDFFLRVARCFPVLQNLLVTEAISVMRRTLDDFPTIRRDQVVQFLHLKTLQFCRASLPCVEQFLNENITHLPRLAELTVIYRHLTIVTHDFTRQETRRNCAHVTELVPGAILPASKAYYDYFPSL